MSKFDHEWKKFFKKNTPPEQYIEEYLIKLEKLDKDEFDFWKDFQLHLMDQREARKADIEAAIGTSQKVDLEGIFSRIVSSDYNDDPLCVYGSICEPGRFNFGALPSYYSNFGALYLASSQPTAYLEKFHGLETDKVGEGQLTRSELSLDNAPSHLYVRVDLKLENYLDLRTDEALSAFLDAVKDITPDQELVQRWKALCKKKNRHKAKRQLKTVQTVEHLKSLIFDPNFKQWISWLDCPSHSQWFAHYALKCGVQGIVYPSVRADGYNIAVFPDNFRESSAVVKLKDKVASVPADRTEMNSSNYLWFSKPLSEIKQSAQSPN